MENLGNRTHTATGEPLPLDALAAVQLLDLFRDPDRDVDRIVEFISHNPALAAETLRRCNSAVFRGAERTTDIFEAVSRLGFYELYGIIADTTGVGRVQEDSVRGERKAVPQGAGAGWSRS